MKRKSLRFGEGFLIAGAMTLFVMLAALVWSAESPYWDWDLAASRAVQSTESPALTVLMRVVSWPGDEVLWATVFVGVAVAVLLIFRRWREAIILVGVVLTSQALKIGIKNLIGRPRPQPDIVNVLIHAHEIDSFPSGHTVHYTVTFGFLWFLTYRLVKPPAARWPLLILFGGMVVLVGPARIYLGAHWISDIIGGHLLGAAILAAGIALYQRWIARLHTIKTAHNLP